MSTFPLDVLAEILCRLPIDCVLRFRCVLKSWLALIDSPQFAKLHLTHSLKTNSSIRVILRETDYFRHKKRCFYSLAIDFLTSRVVTPKEMKNPLKSCDFNTKILGSCHGLLLISNTVDDIALWNPSTGKYKKLPFLSVGREDGHIRFGFGYDVVNDDYKVVRVVQFFGTELDSGRGPFSSDVKAYSLKSNSWKVVEEFPYYIRNKEEPGVYLNGALHWIASSTIKKPGDFLKKIIVAFDLGTEKCSIVPYIPFTEGIFTVKLAVLGGSLCVLQSYHEHIYYDYGGNEDLGLEHMHVWAMEEYGVEDSWDMVMSIEREDEVTGHTVVPLAYSKSGEEILVERDNKRFVWTSIEEGSTKIVDTQFGTLREFLYFNSFIYSGSLVQLGSSDDGSNLKKPLRQDKRGQRRILKKRGDDFLSKGFKLKL